VIGLKLDKSRFFLDSSKLLAKVDAAKRKNLSFSGAVLRRSAQESMRYRNKPAPAGQPPSAHKEGKGPLLRKRLFFAFEPATESVVVGPEALSGAKADAPELMERGGTAQRSYYRTSRSGRTLKSPAAKAAFVRKIRAGTIRRERVKKSITVAARPFMGPTLARNQTKLQGVWADTVK